MGVIRILFFTLIWFNKIIIFWSFIICNMFKPLFLNIVIYNVKMFCLFNKQNCYLDILPELRSRCSGRCLTAATWRLSGRRQLQNEPGIFNWMWSNYKDNFIHIIWTCPIHNRNKKKMKVIYFESVKFWIIEKSKNKIIEKQQFNLNYIMLSLIQKNPHQHEPIDLSMQE